jgi:hypothetical protein
MAQKKGKNLTWDIRSIVETLGVAEVLRQVGKDEIIRHITPKAFLQERGISRFLAELTKAQRRELQRRLNEEATN